MVIEFDKNVFDSTDFKGINFLLQLCTYKNRYEVFVEFAFGIENTLIFKELHYDDQELLRQIYNSRVQAQNSGSGDIIVTPNYVVCKNPTTDRQLNIEEAIRFLIQPVSIILENSKNDSYFVEAIFKHFNNSGKLLTHLENGWIQFENAGGCDNISNFLEGKMQSFNNLPKDNRLYLKCFILMDSDKIHPNANLSESKNKTKTFLDNHEIPYKILKKRSMENYLPFEAYQEITNTNFNNWKNCFHNLDDTQKNHLNIETGFSKKDGQGNPKKDRIAINTETNNLYANLTQENYDILNTGLKQIGDFKTTFPLYFNSSHVTKTTLLAREGGTDDNNEFLEILEKIYELL